MEPSITLTFGHYIQKEPWADVRTLTWSEMAQTATSHEVGAKTGTCFVPAVFAPSVGKAEWNKGENGQWRVKAAARQIDAVFLDADAGHSLEEITTAVKAKGWAAIVSSTHSHLTTESTVSLSVWEKTKDPAAILKEKGYLPRVCEDATMVGITGRDVLLKHEPCPKFRVIIPLDRPWKAEDYSSQEEANNVWKGRIEALAHALSLQHDQSCVDTSRLFYLPRCNVPSQVETARIKGRVCDIWSLPDAPPKGPVPNAGGSGFDFNNAFDSAEFTDQKTRDVINISRWCAEYGERFQIADALHSRTPSMLVGKNASGKEHIDCPNKDEHSQQGRDRATFVINASEARNEGFVIHCMHAHCVDHDRIQMLHLILQNRQLSIDDLTDPRFLIKAAQEEPFQTIEVPLNPWDEFIVPPFPLDVLPNVVSEAVLDRHERTGADLSAVSMAALSAMAAALSAENTIRPRRNDDSWLERPILWVLFCGPPSSMKTPTIKWAMAALTAMQKEGMAKYIIAKKEWDDTTEDDRGEEPTQPDQLITNDTTYEAIVDILAVQNRGILMYRDEFSGFIGALDRYASGRGGGAERAFYIEAWNGNSYQSNRKGRSAFVPNLAVDFVGGIQPEKLREMKDLGSDGLLQRFLPVVIKDGLLPRDIPAKHSGLYYALVRDMAELEPADYTIGEEGHRELDGLFERLHHLETSGAFGNSFSSFLGKMRGYAARLTLMLHCADENAIYRQGKVIGADAVRKAARLIEDFIIPHGAAFYSESVGAAITDETRTIAGYILTKKKERIVTSDLTRNVSCCRGMDPFQVSRAVGPLVAGGWLSAEKPYPSNNAWLVNENVFTFFSEEARKEEKRRAAACELIQRSAEQRRTEKREERDCAHVHKDKNLSFSPISSVSPASSSALLHTRNHETHGPTQAQDDKRGGAA
jgi:hypothetical protein